jgi:hypothetical protein
MRVFLNIDEGVNLADDQGSSFKIGPAASFNIYVANGSKISTSLGVVNLHNPLAPRLVSATIAADDSHVDITFNEGVWGDDSASEPLIIGSISVGISDPNSGISGWDPPTLTATDGSELVGGETTVRLNLINIVGKLDGNEILTIQITRGTVFDEDGNVDWGTKYISSQLNPSVPETSGVEFDPTSGWLAVGDTLTAIITADYPGDTAGEITINSKPIDDGSFADNGDNTYTVTYTVEENDDGIADDAQIPISVVLQNGSASSTAFTTSPDAGDSPAIDATPPAVDAYTVGGNVIYIGLPAVIATTNATSSDGGSGIASYLWTQIYATGTNVAITFDDATTWDTNINVTDPGSYIARLTVTDNVGNSAYDDFAFGVSNNGPIIVDGAPYWKLDPIDLTVLFSIDIGDSATSTSQITSQLPIIATTTSSHGTVDVFLPINLVITKDDGSVFDATFIGTHDASAEIVSSDIGDNLTLRAATGFGTPGATFYFSAPVTIKIPVAAFINGAIFNIRRNSSPGEPWTAAGLTATSTDACLNGIGSNPVSTAVVMEGFVTINTCRASAFVVYTSNPAPVYGVGGSGGIAYTPVSTSTLVSVFSLQQQITSLIAQLNVLILQAKAKGLNIPAAAQALVGTTPSFTRDLEYGMTGEDVKLLQIYLNTHGYPVSTTGDGSLGHETTYFGPATKAALIKFQQASETSPALGYFGAKTRAYVGAHP